MAIKNVYLKLTCTCGTMRGIHDYTPSPNPNRFGVHTVSCLNCGKVFYTGQDKIVALSYTLSAPAPPSNNGTVNGNVTSKVPRTSNYIVLDTACTCGSDKGLYEKVISPAATSHFVSCLTCKKMFYAGHDYGAAKKFGKLNGSQVGVAPQSKLNTTPITLASPCVCNSINGIFDLQIISGKPMCSVFCSNCGFKFYSGNSISKATSFTGINPYVAPKEVGCINFNVPKNRPVQHTHTMMEAYEANKTADTCVACGSPTKPNYTLTPFIKYCGCVEKLPKERSAQPESFYEGSEQDANTIVPMATVDQISILTAIYVSSLTQEAAIKSCFPRSTKVAYFQLTKEEANELINNSTKP